MKFYFTNPKIKTYPIFNPDGTKGKNWYVWFRIDGGNPHRYSEGINDTDNHERRWENAIVLREALKRKLESGWNPSFKEPHEIKQEKLKLIPALEFALEKMKPRLAAKTFSCYSGTVNFFITAVKKLKYNSINADKLERVHVKLILEEIKTKRKWSNKAYNKNLGYIKAVFSELLQWDIIKNNPAHEIKSLKVNQTLANRTATDEELDKIKNKLLKDFPNFYNFMATMFHTGARPDEILQIRISMIDLKNKTITLPPEITKTDIYRIIPINKYFEEMLIEVGIKNSNKDFFLFGTSQNHRNRGLKPKTSFYPSKERIKPDAASRIWRRLIKEDLGIDVNLYATKHLGGDKKILAGLDLDSLRELYGHSSKRMTERYAKVIKEIYRKNIMEKSPDF